jgi:hypothetical protein
MAPNVLGISWSLARRDHGLLTLAHEFKFDLMFGRDLPFDCFLLMAISLPLFFTSDESKGDEVDCFVSDLEVVIA